jgi:hypothetical protein
MTIALIALNLVFLLCTIAFNAELLSLAGSDITLKHFDEIAEIGQILSSFGMTLLAWKVIAKYKTGKDLAKAWALALVVLYPTTYYLQNKIPEVIMENMPHAYKVAGLYAYVLKKGYVSEVIKFPGIPYDDIKGTGAHTAFTANIGILLNPDSQYIKGIDENFSGFSAKVFKGYWLAHKDELYERYTERGLNRFKEVYWMYQRLEALRAENPRSNKYQYQALNTFVTGGTEQQINMRYALGIRSGIRDGQQVLKQNAMHILAADALGPLYVKGMLLNADQKQFEAYIPYIANNMASAITNTDMQGAQGQMVLKNMVVVPLALFSSLFFGVISFVVLIFSLVEYKWPGTERKKLKIGMIFFLLILPFIISNPIARSPGYKALVQRSGHGVEVIRPILQWSMITEGWLYDLKVKIVGN